MALRIQDRIVIIEKEIVNQEKRIQRTKDRIKTLNEELTGLRLLNPEGISPRNVVDFICNARGLKRSEFLLGSEGSIMPLRRVYAMCAYELCPNETTRSIAKEIGKEESTVRFYLKTIYNLDSEFLLFADKVRKGLKEEFKVE